MFQSEEQEITNEGYPKFLDELYLQKTSYKMGDEILEHDEDYGLESPCSIYDSIPKFETCQVYKVLKKNSVGNFIAFK